MNSQDTLESLLLCVNHFSLHPVCDLLQAASKLSSLRQLDLSSSCRDTTKYAKLASSLQSFLSNSTVEMFCFGYNGVDDVLFKYMCEGLLHNRHMTSLIMFDNPIIDFSPLELLLRVNTVLKHLNLAEMNGAVFDHLCRVLPLNRTLDTLMLRGTRPPQPQLFVEALRHAALRSLDLSNAGVKLPTTLALLQLTSLVELTLNRSYIGPVVRASNDNSDEATLEDVMRHNVSLCSLSLSNCKLGFEGVRQIIAGVAQHTRLTRLVLSSNSLEHTGGGTPPATIAFDRAIANGSLRVLDLSHVDITSHINQLTRGVLQTTTLDEFYLISKFMLKIMYIFFVF